MAEETTSTGAEATASTESKATTISQLSDDVEVGGRKDWGNKLVVNTGLNPVVNFNFMLRVEGVFDLPCKAVKGIRRENEFDYIQEGGLNDYVHLKRKAISKPFTFQVERYVGVNWVDPMPLGTELVLPLILFVNTHVFPGLQPVRNYVFTGCTVIGKDYGELNAEASGLLLETVTIAYREMVCLDIPSETYKSDDVWRFNGKEKQGAGERHYNSNLYNKEWESTYSSSEVMKTRAAEARWKPEKDADGNLKTRFAKNYETYVTDYNEAIDKEIENAKTPEEIAAAQAKKKIVAKGPAKRKYVHSATASREGSAKYNTGEETQAQMEEKATQYQYSETATREGSAKYNTGEKTRAQMEEKAGRWKPEKDADGSLKAKYGRDYEKYVTDYNKAIDTELANAKTDEEAAAAQAKKKIVTKGPAKRKYVHSATASREGSAKYNTGEKTQAQMEEKATQYQYSETATREGSARYIAGEETQAQMQKKAGRWKPEKDADGGLKAKYGRDYEKYVTDYNKAIDTELANAKTDEEAAAAQAKKKIVTKGPAKRKYVHSATASREGSARYNTGEKTQAQLEERAVQYQYSETATREGSARYNAGEKTQAQLQEKAVQYEHSKKATRKGAATYQDSELTRAAMEDKAARWTPQKSGDGGLKPKYGKDYETLVSKGAQTQTARQWPPTRSAKQITEYLKKH